MFVGKLTATCLLLQLFLIVVPKGSSAARYDNHRLYRVFPDSPAQTDLLNEMQSEGDESVIFLHERKNFAKIVVAPERISEFQETSSATGLKWILDSANVQQMIDEEKWSNLQRSSTFNWESYQELTAINEWLWEQEKLHPSIVSVRSIGKSFEKRDILTMKISHGAGRKAVFLESGIHAREWISPAVATFFINGLLNSNSTEMQEMARKYDWYFVVNTNPDGYVYTHTNDRFWRKTRQPYGSCYGADPNRNFNASWGTVGVSSKPCSQIYPGRSAHSEMEIQALTNYISRIENLRLYISLHSFSQVLLLPYGYKSDVPDNHDDLYEIAENAVNALSKRYGTTYGYGTVQEIMYPASGSSIDWVLDNTKAKLSFCYELRPHYNDRRQGFELDAEEIIPTGEETTDSILEMVRSSAVLGYFD